MKQMLTVPGYQNEDALPSPAELPVTPGNSLARELSMG